MDDRANRVAALANAAAYDTDIARRYVEGAPHIKHARLRAFYGGLVVRVFDRAAAQNPVPRVLDLGAGEGSVTLPFLELGARVTAVDVSKAQLEGLARRCGAHAERLEVRCEDVLAALATEAAAGRTYDIVVASSFLHHVPDYLGLLRAAVGLLAPGGQIFTFQDPLRYDSVGTLSRAASIALYMTWRVFRGDLLGGAFRRLRRAAGVYTPKDAVEYHVARGGVDQDAIRTLLVTLGLECEIIRYFSTHSAFALPIGERLGIENTFAVLAGKPVHRS